MLKEIRAGRPESNDGYEACKVLADQDGGVQLAFCWSYVRREFYDLTGPIAAEALTCIAVL